MANWGEKKSRTLKNVLIINKIHNIFIKKDTKFIYFQWMKLLLLGIKMCEITFGNSTELGGGGAGPRFQSL